MEKKEITPLVPKSAILDFLWFSTFTISGFCSKNKWRAPPREWYTTGNATTNFAIGAMADSFKLLKIMLGSYPRADSIPIKYIPIASPAPVSL